MKFDIQFIFCRNTDGKVSFNDTFQRQPPIGVLTIASFLKNNIPDLKTEVIDGHFYSNSEIYEKIDSKTVGFSCWYSNYQNSLIVAKKIKEIHPDTIIIFGGPYISTVGKNILLNNSFIDYIVVGEGEITMLKYFQGIGIENNIGLYNRNNILNTEKLKFSTSVNLNTLPNFDLTLLSPSYYWLPEKSFASMSSFPLSGIRGCIHYKKRCEYCSIPFDGYRFMSGEKYWNNIKYLYNKYSINHFFETGDIFSKSFLNDLVNTKPNIDIMFRIYGYLGLYNQYDKSKLKNIGVENVYLGVESVIHFNNENRRKYPTLYSFKKIINEINEYAAEGLNVIPGFLLGLPKENNNTLLQNKEMIEEIISLPNVQEASINIVLPLPGTLYFDYLLSNSKIAEEYYSKTGREISKSDYFNLDVLSRLFTKYYTNVYYEELEAVISKFENAIGESMTNWNNKKLAI